MAEENFPRGGFVKAVKDKKIKKERKVEQDLFKDAADFPSKKEEKRSKHLRKESNDENKGRVKGPIIDNLFTNKKKSGKTGFSGDDHGEKKTVDVKPEELSSKPGQPGCRSMLVLGCVAEINDYELVMALPNGVRSPVPITKISDAYRECLERYAESQNGTDAEVLHSLADLFKVGMLFPCRDIPSEKSSKKLTINPRVINQALTVDSFRNSTVFYGSISGCEDTGYIVDTGVAELNGFIQNKNAVPYIQKYNDGKKLKVGQVLRCQFLKRGSNKKLKDEKYLPITIDTDQMAEPVKTKTKISDVIPGVKVKTNIKQIVEDHGLIVSFTEYTALIHISQLPRRLSTYSVGNQIECCVLYINKVTRSVTLTALPHIVKCSVKLSNMLGFDTLHIGKYVRNAKVSSTSSKGVHVKLEGGNLGMADLDNIEENTDYKKGTEVRCIVTDIDYEANRVIVSFKSNLIEESIKPSDLIGDIVMGKVYSAGAKKVKVTIMEKFNGVLRKMMSVPNTTLQPGSEISCRVLSVNQKNVLNLCNKSWAMEPKYPIITQIDHVEIGQFMEGYVLKLSKGKSKIGFYGGIEGTIQKKWTWTDGSVPRNIGDAVVCQVDAIYAGNTLGLHFQDNHEECVIPQNAKGQIIGKGGGKIKSLSQEFDVKIFIKADTCYIYGSVDNRSKAKKEILRIAGIQNLTNNTEKALDRKRNNSESNEAEPQFKKQKVNADDTVIEISIPGSDMGKVIGKGGSTVNKIRFETGACVNFNEVNQGGADKAWTCVITGKQESVIKAKQMVHDILNGIKPDQTVIEISIPGADFGKVIGRGGSTINKIRQDSGVKISLNDGEMEGTDRTYNCVIIGTQESAIKAKQMVYDCLNGEHGEWLNDELGESALDKLTAIKMSDKTVLEMAISDEDYGKVMGIGGANINKIQKDSGAKVTLKDAKMEGTDNKWNCVIIGTQKTTSIAKHMVSACLSNSKVASKKTSSSKKEEILVPKELVGKIMGMKGKTITKIRSKTGARINFEDSEMVEYRVCEISGPEAAVKKARRIIEARIGTAETKPGNKTKKRMTEEDESEEELFESSDSDNGEPDGTVELTIMVPSTCVQKLMQNHAFKKLQTKSIVKISVTQDDDQEDGVCTIAGEESAVMDTKNKVEHFLKNVLGKDKKAQPTLQLTSSLTWDTDLKLPNKRKDDSSSDDSEDEDVQKPVKKSKADKRREKNEEEKRIYEYERKKLEGEIVPETADDFDRLVVNSPNSSVVWLRYMAFYLETSEIDKARAVANRALKTISFSEEREKQNIWVAFLNLENMYGTRESIGKVLARAIEQCEPLDIYLPLVNIYVESSKIEEAERLYSIMVKKYSYNKMVWGKFGEFYFQQNRPESARKLFQRALKSLENRDHVEIISKFAQLEFKCGEPERGKTMFESILSTYPKRTDVWSVYVDLLTKMANHEVTRGVFNRMIGLRLPAKKIKFFFKKYLEFEERFGNETQIAEVKQKAVNYVESGGVDDKQANNK